MVYWKNLDLKVILGEDLNFIMDKTLDAQGETPLLKLSSIAEITKIAEKHDLCDIFRIRNPEKKRFTFRQPTPRRLRRLDYIYTSNSLQDKVAGLSVYF